MRPILFLTVIVIYVWSKFCLVMGPRFPSLISQMNHDEVFATLGDDDTIMLFARSNEDALQIERKLLALIDDK